MTYNASSYLAPPDRPYYEQSTSRVHPPSALLSNDLAGCELKVPL